MSTTTTERRESAGIVGDALRRPIQKAVKEGVREALAEQEESGRRRSGGGAGSEGGGGRGKFAMLALLAVGVAAIMLWRRRGGGDGGMTQSIREKSKTIGSDSPGTTEAESGGPDYEAGETETGGGAIEGEEQSDEAEDAAPEATSE